MRPAKTILIANNFSPIRGGSAIVYHNLAKHLLDDVIVVAPKLNYLDNLPSIGWREHDRSVPYRVVRLPLLRTVIEAPDQQMSVLQRILFILTDIEIRIRLILTLFSLMYRSGARTVCLGELMSSGWLISLLHMIPGVKSMVYVHGEEITTRDDYDPSVRRRTQALEAADEIVVVSRFTRAAVLDVIGKSHADKVVLIENGVDTSLFQAQGRRQDLVDLYGLQGHFVFVTVCRLLEKKGIDNTIRAFAAQRAELAGCKYLIVGSGPYRDDLAALVAQHGLENDVVFSGQVTDEDLIAHYCLGDVFIMPNRELPNGDTEGFGLVFLEANACGVPVIGGGDGGSRDAIKHGVSGLIVNGNSVAEIGAAMLELRRNDVLREKLRIGGMEFATAADWKNKAEVFRALCNGVKPAA